MLLLAHHEWSIPLVAALIGGGLSIGMVWLKSVIWGHKHTHCDGTTHTHPHKHSHEDHEH